MTTEPFASLLPDFIRLPNYGQREPHCTLTRTALDLLVRPQEANKFKPPVKSKLFSPSGAFWMRLTFARPAALTAAFFFRKLNIWLVFNVRKPSGLITTIER